MPADYELSSLSSSRDTSEYKTVEFFFSLFWLSEMVRVFQLVATLEMATFLNRDNIFGYL